MKMKVFFVICGLLLLSSCSILPPKLWTDEEVLDRLYDYYGIEFEILTVENEKPGNIFTDYLIKGKHYTMSPIDNPDIVIGVTSEVTYSRGLFPGYSYFFFDNYTTLMFNNEFEMFLKSSNIPCDADRTVSLDKSNAEEVVTKLADFFNDLGKTPPFNTEGAWYSRPTAILKFVYEQDEIKVDFIEILFHFETQEKLPYLYMDADEVLNRLREEIAAMEEERY